MSDTDMIIPDLPADWPVRLSIRELVTLAGQRELTALESCTLSALLDSASADPDIRHKGRQALISMQSQNLSAQLARERIMSKPDGCGIYYENQQCVVILPASPRDRIEFETKLIAADQQEGDECISTSSRNQTATCGRISSKSRS